MSALACEPGKGSELEVGYQAMLAAATEHDVWVLTDADSVASIEEGIRGSRAGSRIRLVGIPLGIDREGLARLTVPGFHLYYDRWQRRAAKRALELDREENFDILHHATLASYWTRTGVAAVDKPLVWGPVGGAVEPPFGMLRDLGATGLLEDIARVSGRRLLARFGPPRRMRKRAAYALAQNNATLSRLRTHGPARILSNALGVLIEVPHRSPVRDKDVYVVGRLIPWKAPLLALRALRYLDRTDSVLHFCGDGPERKRLQRAAQEWGLADRVRFHGWMDRQDLLERISEAGALLHPALHEEAGLCVAEALALGTPVVCLDNGGPAELLLEWPSTPSHAVRPSTPTATAKRLARGLEDVLSAELPVRTVPLPPVTPFADELLTAYELVHSRERQRAIDGRAMVAFPRGKEQVFAESPNTLAAGIGVYAFGKRAPRPLLAAAQFQAVIPLVRQLRTSTHQGVAPICGWSVWNDVCHQLNEYVARDSQRWIFYRSRWEKQKMSALLLNERGAPVVFVTLEPITVKHFRPSPSGALFRVPICIATLQIGEWMVRVLEPLPRFHRPPRANVNLLRAITQEVSSLLEAELSRPLGTLTHWRPIHGDFVPWNLREDGSGGLWLLDWEDVAWGPPLADLLRYVIAEASIRGYSADRIARRVARMLAGCPVAETSEAAAFWTRHPNVRPPPIESHFSRRTAEDVERVRRESSALRLLAAYPEQLVSLGP